jgi:hypothetical protein
MTNWQETRLTIIFPIIVGVILAVLYDVLQEVFRWIISPPPPITISPLLLSTASKAAAGVITIGIGLAILLLKYRK